MAVARVDGMSQHVKDGCCYTVDIDKFNHVFHIVLKSMQMFPFYVMLHEIIMYCILSLE